MTTQMMTARDRVNSVRALLEKAKPQIALALPRHLNADRMLRIAMTSIQRNPALLECDPISLVGAVIQSSQLGLEPDGVLGQAYLIPFRNNRKNTREVQFQPGYRGLLLLARRSGEIGGVDARVVYERDHFKYSFGLNPVLEHVPSRDEERGNPTYVYAIVRLKDGAAQFDVMSAGEIQAHRKRYSRAADESPWVTAWEEMAKKTVLKRVLKLSPASVELQRAIALDEHAEGGLAQDLDAVAVAEGAIEAGNGHAEPKGALDQLTEKLGQEDAESPAPDDADPRSGLLSAIAEARIILDPRPTEREWAAIYKEFLHQPVIETADPAMLDVLLVFVRQLGAKDKAAVARFAQIIGAAKA